MVRITAVKAQPLSAPLRAALTRLTAVAENRTGDPVWQWQAAGALTVLHTAHPPYEPLNLPDSLPAVVDAVAELRRVQTDLRAAIAAAADAAFGGEALRCADAWAQLEDALTLYGPPAGDDPAAVNR